MPEHDDLEYQAHVHVEPSQLSLCSLLVHCQGQFSRDGRYGGRQHERDVFAGFSFGAAVGLRAACEDARVRALIGVGTPVAPVADDADTPRTYTFEFLRECARPKLFVSGERDRFGPRPKLEALVASLPEPKKLVFIEGADHFFEGRLRELRQTIEEWVKETLRSQLSALS